MTEGNVGAVLESKDYTYATTGWKDKLTSYAGQSITYDAMGNPVTYRGHSLTWDRVRLLASYDSHTFAYNANGMRVRKDTTTYELDGNNILSETMNDNTKKKLGKNWYELP